MKNIAWIIAALAVTLPAWGLDSRHGYVLENELQGFGDFDGDGDLDVVVVTRSTGAARVGYQNPAGDLDWGATFYSGVTNAAAFASGRLLSPKADALAVTGRSANRVALLDMGPFSLYLQPTNLFPAGNGPTSVAAVGISLAGSPADMHDLAIATAWNDPSAKSHLFRVTNTGQTEVVTETTTGTHERGSRVIVVPGGAGFYGVFERGATDSRFRLFNLPTAASVASSFTEVSGLDLEAEFVHESFSGSNMEFVFYKGGEESIQVSQANVLGSLGALKIYSIGRKIDRISLISAGGKPGLFITYDRGEEGGVYSFDGKSAPILLETIEAPLGEKITGLLGYRDGKFGLLTGSFRAGETTNMHQFTYDGKNWNAGAVATLPTSATGSGASLSNVFLWDGEPMVDEGAQLVDIQRAADWTSTATLGGSLSIKVEAHTYGGLADGLGSAAAFTIGNAPTGTTFAVPNQMRADSSMVAEGVPLAEGLPSISISPAPGDYAEYITPKLTSPDSSNKAFYRFGNSGPWQAFNLADSNARIRPTGETLRAVSISYYAEATGGQRSPVFSARYTFAGEPGTIDSDSDGVPDFVELAAGLNPTAGANAGEDGFTDLEELILGTDPKTAEKRSFTLPDGTAITVDWPPSRTTDSDGDGFDDFTEFAAGTDLSDPASVPTGSDVVHWQNVFEIAAKPFSLPNARSGIPGLESYSDSSGTQGTLVSTYALDGEFYGSARTDHNGISGLGDPTAYLQKIPGDARDLFVVVATEATYEIKGSTVGEGNGRELIALVPVPEMAVGEVPYSYSGMPPQLEAAAWIGAAKTHYRSLEPPLTKLRLDYLDTLKLLLAERVVAHYLGTDPVTFTGFRDIENDPATPTHAELLALQDYTDADTAAYLLQSVFDDIESFVDKASQASIAAFAKLANDIYRLSAYEGAKDPGLYPSPVDTLRDVVRALSTDGKGGIVLPGDESRSSYAAGHTLTSAELASAVKTLSDLLASIGERPVEEFTLVVKQDGTFEDASDEGTKIGLFNADGSAFDFPDSLILPPGAELAVKAFTDRAFPSSVGEGVEVISAELISVPQPPPSDSNRDMMPDEWAAYFFAGASADPFEDSDGDGYSNLQEFFESTDPTSFSSKPTVEKADLSAPELNIEHARPNHLKVSFIFPGEYADRIGFGLLIQTDLRRFFIEANEIAALEGTDTYGLKIRRPKDESTFYRFEMFLK